MFNKKPFHYGVKSGANLATCHIDLQKIFREVIKYYDCSVTCGERGEMEQDDLFSAGKSKVQYPNSKHNTQPSLAVDVAPYPIKWEDINRFAEFIRFCEGIAIGKFNIRLRVGMDWNGDWRSDESFLDYPHIELHSRKVKGRWIKYE